MISFLKKIRKSLIDSGSAQRYTLYAMGEILLVIIGILLALLINEKRNSIINHKSELLTLDALKTEFEETKNDIEQYINENENIIKTNMELHEYCSNEEDAFQNPVFDSLLYNSLWYANLILNQGTLSELIYSGKLSSLSDRQLRVLLSSWSGRYDRTKTSDSAGLEYMQQKNSQYFDQKLSWMELSKYDRYNIVFRSLMEANFDRDLLRSELEFENFIYSHIWNNRTKITYAQSLLELNDEILERIEFCLNDKR